MSVRVEVHIELCISESLSQGQPTIITFHVLGFLPLIAICSLLYKRGWEPQIKLENLADTAYVFAVPWRQGVRMVSTDDFNDLKAPAFDPT